MPWRAVPYRTPYRILTFRMLSCRPATYSFVSSHTVQVRVVSSHTISCRLIHRIVLSHVVPCRVVSHRVVSSHSAPCRPIPCRVVPYCAGSCRIVPYRTVSSHTAPCPKESLVPSPCRIARAACCGYSPAARQSARMSSCPGAMVAAAVRADHIAAHSTAPSQREGPAAADDPPTLRPLRVKVSRPLPFPSPARRHRATGRRHQQNRTAPIG